MGQAVLSGKEPAKPKEEDTTPIEIAYEARKKKTHGELTESLYENYEPERLTIKGAKPHPTPLVQSAAMAAVNPPEPTYRPILPEGPIKSGKISDIQLEAVVYAGQAHEKVLPDGNRQGFFIGDGTGVGKGREIAAILWDNWNKGRKKAVWISEKKELTQDAKRDVLGVGWNPDLITEHHKIKASIKHKTGKRMPVDIDITKGILFSTYDMIKSGLGKRGKTDIKTRLDQIIDWLGEDFDGVIVFDEAHNMLSWHTPNIQAEAKRKAGDNRAAAILVKDLVRPDIAQQMEEQNPDARLLPVLAEEVSAETRSRWPPLSVFRNLRYCLWCWMLSRRTSQRRPAGTLCTGCSIVLYLRMI